jgi:anaerobic magnesium-protoporphyrin IX monomethyl ester cyclase
LSSILVCHSYFLDFDKKQLERAKPYPPLATIQVAAMFRSAGREVGLFDAMLADGTEDFRAKFEAEQPDIVVFYEDNYNYLSKMCLGRMREACCEMIATAQRGGARVVAAGSDASDSPEVYLRSGADAVIIGEGLASLAVLADRLSADLEIDVSDLCEGLPDVTSLASNGASVSKMPSPLLQREIVKRPAWDLIDVDAYRRVWLDAHGYFSINMAGSRGCSFRCNWCAKPIWGNRYLQRTPADVAEEMLFLKRDFRVDHVWFADDIFGFKADWVAEFADVVSAAGGGVPFTIQLRADLVTEKMAIALARAGCREVWIGAESGSQKILDAMNKGATLASIVRARELLGQQGVRVGFFLMLGYPGEDIEEIIATRDLVRLCAPDDVGVSVAYPLPGTGFYESVRKQLGEKRNWNESNDLEMMFEGTFRSAFYHRIRDLLHDQVTDGWSDQMLQRWDDVISMQAEYRYLPEPSDDARQLRAGAS